jgi:gliding motility-associated-like protein
MYFYREFMRKGSLIYRFLIFVFLLFSFQKEANTQNIAGGEVSYKFLYKVVGEFVFNHYEVTVKLYKECTNNSNLPFDVSIYLALINPPNVTPTYNGGSFLQTAPMTNFYVTKADMNSCAPGQPSICYQVGVYKAHVALAENWGEWYLYVQGMVREQAKFVNVSTDGIGRNSFGQMGYTYTCRIPGMLFTNITTQPSSPVFKKEYPFVLCANQPFQYDFSAEDPDGDSLSYSFVPAMQGYIFVTPRYPTTADKPPFLALDYNPGFAYATPLGNAVTIDPISGRISGRAPVMPGRYIVDVEVQKWRNGELVTRHRKEMQFLFSNCTWPRAQLDSTYKNCKGTTINFTNYSTGNVSNYFWDFGDPSTTSDTSSLVQPSYHYPAPGTYQVRLYINKGTTLCKDSAIATAIVDSGLNASFNAARSIAVCNLALYDFTNNSTASTNPITKYSWDFGETTTANDISSLPNPSYTYPTDGSKTVRLIIKNSIGCSDTAFKKVDAFKSLMRAPNDTTICNLDTIALQANTNGYPGAFSWTPNYFLSSTTSPAPLAHPQKDTMYYVSFTDTTGCVARDSVMVKVRDSVLIQLINNDTTICQMDSVFVKATHDGLSVTWNPSSVTNVKADGSTVYAFPWNTGYLVATSHFGSCIAEDSMYVKVVPQPRVSISADTLVCLGAPVPLHASGGAFYLWAPASTLDNPLSPDPIAHPVTNTAYTVSVYDTLGCPKHTMATIRVGTYRALYVQAGKDTMVVQGEPVQLFSSGGQYYHWSPADYLSDPNIANPVSRPYGDIVYTLTISNDDHCSDSIQVKLRGFKDPDIYVPTAFTPNGDGKNDLFKVFPVGFVLEDLKIYDRWGNIIFATKDANKGWDGKFKGEVLGTGTFVWVAYGHNIKTGKPVMKKGNITLLR